jgi:hypothetical protein
LRVRKALQQRHYLAADLSTIVNHRHHRWLTMWLWNGSAPAIVTYRVNRLGYLLLGNAYPVARIFLWPFFFVLRLFGPVLDIHYQSEIGPRLMTSAQP